MFYSTFAGEFDLADTNAGNVEQFKIFDDVEIFS